MVCRSRGSHQLCPAAGSSVPHQHLRAPRVVRVSFCFLTSLLPTHKFLQTWRSVKYELKWKVIDRDLSSSGTDKGCANCLLIFRLQVFVLMPPVAAIPCFWSQPSFLGIASRFTPCKMRWPPLNAPWSSTDVQMVSCSVPNYIPNYCQRKDITPQSSSIIFPTVSVHLTENIIVLYWPCPSYMLRSSCLQKH